MGCPASPGENCGLESVTGPCTEYTDKWFYDMNYGHITRQGEVITKLCPRRWLCEVLVRRLRAWEESLRDRGSVSGGVCQSPGVCSMSAAPCEGPLQRGLQGVAL